MPSNPPTSTLPSTRWDWISQLQEGADSPAAREALALLCQGYWYPVYARLRSQGYSREEAEDLTQGFFEKLIRTRAFEKADPARGRLRSLLLTSLTNHVKTVHTAENAQKRGGEMELGHALLGDTHWAEQRYLEEAPSKDDEPDVAFNRRWWALVLEQALRAVAVDYASRGKSAVFDVLRPFLEDSRPGGQTLADAAAVLGMNGATLRVIFARLRRQLADEVREIVQRTTGSVEALEEELLLFK